jgi:peptidyl-dipeptidase Dcp
MADNPFLETWNTPFGVPPFDRIRPEHFPAALDRGMDGHLAEIEAVADSEEVPSFANTVAALERSGRLLRLVRRTFDNLVSSLGGDELQTIELMYSPRLAQHDMRPLLHPALFRRVADLHDRRHRLGLEADQLRLVERYYLNFVRSGAALPQERKARMAEIAGRLATLQTRFGQNVLHDENEWQLLLAEADLNGLPDFVRDGAHQAALEREIRNGYVVTLSRSSVEPFLTFSPRRDLRQAAYEAWISRGAHPGLHDNTPLIREILVLRAERAKLLGYPSYADFQLADSMAGQPAAAERLLMRIWEPAKRKAASERAELEALARSEGMNDPIEPWDWRYYAERVRQARYDLDDAEAKPYFALDNVVRAAFGIASQLFGVSFAERADVPLYHPDVRAYEVSEGKRHVGLFLHDNFARTGKRSGAWMSSYRDAESFDGAVAPIVANNNNFAKGTPTLLGLNDAETLFHELGHGMHGLLSRARYPSQSGTSVRRDFVEFPSQIFEHWLYAPETLRNRAVHYETGEPMPEELLRRLLAARSFNTGFETVELAGAALLDLALHMHPAPDTLDLAEFERDFLDRIGMPLQIGLRHRPGHFQHLFAGEDYAAGYYAYLWAEVLDADGFEAFREARNLFDPGLAASLKTIYAAGDTRDPMDLYMDFRGREPSVEALLKERDLGGVP